MGSWVYGLVEVEKKNKEGIFKELVLSEVYFHDSENKKKRKPHMFQPVEWEELKTKEEQRMILDDITKQLKYGFEFYAKLVGESYKIYLRKRKNDRKTKIHR
jgi:hypothetical protein